MKKRFHKHLAFKKKVRMIERKLAAGAICPLGKDIITGYFKALHELERLPSKWQIRVGRYVERQIAAYHEPVVFANGREYSAYDMDQEMMYR